MSTLTSTLNDLEMNLDEDIMESMAVILGTKRTDEVHSQTERPD